MTATATLTRTEPKRWPVNPEVIDSPACTMPQYAGYRRAYYLVSGPFAKCSADTLDNLMDKAVHYAREDSRIVRVPMIPYYDDANARESYARPVGTTPTAGGTWQGRCGATLWVTDPDHRYRRMFATLHALDPTSRYMQDGPINGHNVGKLQAWWINGIADRYPSLDGFHVECQQPYRGHGPVCTALDLTWDWRDYAPYPDMGHNTQ